MITFLNPIALAGMTAISIPIILHLIGKRKKKVIIFSTLKFLRKVEQKIAKKLKVTQLLLLLTRIVLFSIICLALAKPILKPPKLPFLTFKGNTSAVIILDNSLSMAYKKNFNSAKEVAINVLSTFYPGDSVGFILTNDFEGLSSRTMTYNFQKIKGKIFKSKISFGLANIKRSLEKAFQLLKQASEPNREIFIITDMQANSFPQTRIPPAKIKPKIFIIDVGEKHHSNIFIESFRFKDVLITTNQTVKIAARLRNLSGEKKNSKLQLFLDGKKLMEKNFSITHRKELHFSFPSPPAGYHKGYLLIEDPDFKNDNKYYFSFEVIDKIPILCLYDPSLGSLKSGKFYFSSVLKPSDVSPFSPEFVEEEKFQRIDLDKYPIVVLLETPRSRKIFKKFMKFIEKGGNGIVFKNCSFLPTIPNERITNIRKTSLTKLNMTIFPIFKTYENLRGINFYRINEIEIQEENTTKILAYFSNKKPAIICTTAKKGKIIAFLSYFTPEWSNLYAHPAFLPLIHQLLYYLLPIKLPPSYYCEKHHKHNLPGIYWENQEPISINVNPLESDFHRIKNPLQIFNDFKTFLVEKISEIKPVIMEGREFKNLTLELLVLLVGVLIIESFLANALIERKR